jgi:hypothetical protein
MKIGIPSKYLSIPSFIARPVSLCSKAPNAASTRGVNGTISSCIAVTVSSKGIDQLGAKKTNGISLSR